MFCLIPEDIATKEVLTWKGLHLFHGQMSSCSQKVRVFLSLKGLDWVSHLIDLNANEHLTPYFLGINPRAVVPVLIDDGKVYIESNDILLHLEKRFPEPQLIPAGMAEQISSSLERENAIHYDLRTLTFRFMFDPRKPSKLADGLQCYEFNGTGKVQGSRDNAVEHEIAFWRNYLDYGISDESACRSAHVFRRSLDTIDQMLAKQDHILGRSISLLDIAWLVYAQRLSDAGYPLSDMHPNVAMWRGRLMTQSSIAYELQMPPKVAEQVRARQRALENIQKTLRDVCFPKLEQESGWAGKSQPDRR